MHACTFCVGKGIMQISSFLLSAAALPSMLTRYILINFFLLLSIWKFKIFLVSSVTPSFLSGLTRFSKLLEKEKSFLKSLTCHPWKLMFLHEYCRPESFFILMYQSFWQKLITKAKSTFLKLHWKNPARCRLLSFEHFDFKLCMNT